MDRATPAARAAERMLEDKEALARAITEALYADMPELMERHGDYGRQKCLQDMRYNLEHLAPSVDLQEPVLFARYVEWLDDLLRARNVGTDEVVRSLRITERILRDRFPPDEAEAVAPCVRAGVDALSGERIDAG